MNSFSLWERARVRAGDRGVDEVKQNRTGQPLLSPKSLDFSSMTGIIPTSTPFDHAQDKSLSTSHADNADQTSEVFETSEVFKQNNRIFIRRGAWHAPAVQIEDKSYSRL
jgi:hypothetical protein